MAIVTLLENPLSAVEYVRRELSDGTALARKVLERNDFKMGRFRLIAPQAVDFSQPLQLGEDLYPLDGNEGLIFARVVKQFVSASRCGVLLQETQDTIVDLQPLAYAKLLIPYREEVYWSVTGPDLVHLSDDETLGIINSASFFPFAAFFYMDAVSSDRGRLTEEDLALVVRTLCGLAVGAFDDRSFLIWWRDDLPFPGPPE
jgi:hypothetical protein